MCLRTSLRNEIDTQERDWPASQPLPDFHCYDMRAVERVGAVTNWNSSVLQSLVHKAAEENQDRMGHSFSKRQPGRFSFPKATCPPVRSRNTKTETQDGCNRNHTQRALSLHAVGCRDSSTDTKPNSSTSIRYFSSLSVLN
jgi:hypothetical protein